MMAFPASCPTIRDSTCQTAHNSSQHFMCLESQYPSGNRRLWGKWKCRLIRETWGFHTGLRDQSFSQQYQLTPQCCMSQEALSVFLFPEVPLCPPVTLVDNRSSMWAVQLFLTVKNIASETPCFPTVVAPAEQRKRRPSATFQWVINASFSMPGRRLCWDGHYVC